MLAFSSLSSTIHGENTPPFIYITCQIGAEATVKSHIQQNWPGFRFAFSRPGFLTFKLPNSLPTDGFDLACPFARMWGASIAKLSGDCTSNLAKQAAEIAIGGDYSRIHVWQRDVRRPGQFGYEPGMTGEARSAEELIRAELGEKCGNRGLSETFAATRLGDRCLDCILIESNVWWAGWHTATDMARCWPGGFYPDEPPAHAVSRAYLKMRESLAWSQMPVKAGDRCAEIGCAPGGASQCLLDMDCFVIGIDPAEVDEVVTSRPRFTHIQKRGLEVKRREFRKTRWLFADINVAPQYTLDTVEAIVTHPEVHVRGMILTLKLPDWSLASELPAQASRVRSWGFADVRLRQLHHNRQEICLAALRPSKHGSTR